MSLIRVSVVSYLNSMPFIHGIRKSPVFEDIDLSLDNPSICAQKLLDNRADLGLSPVAILPLLKDYQIISDYCIGAVGAVTSVMLYSEVPLQNIKNIWLDYQSRTSVGLTKVLAKHYWKISPVWQAASAGYENLTEGTTAAVVIGDRTFELKGKYKYVYDLGEEWLHFSKLPFVFACWITGKNLPEVFLARFNSALEKGMSEIKEISKEIAASGNYNTDVYQYLNQSISYKLDEEKRKGLTLFLNLM
jgi:chorismate dehydratase